MYSATRVIQAVWLRTKCTIHRKQTRPLHTHNTHDNYKKPAAHGTRLDNVVAQDTKTYGSTRKPKDKHAKSTHAATRDTNDTRTRRIRHTHAHTHMHMRVSRNQPHSTAEEFVSNNQSSDNHTTHTFSDAESLSLTLLLLFHSSLSLFSLTRFTPLTTTLSLITSATRSQTKCRPCGGRHCGSCPGSCACSTKSRCRRRPTTTAHRQ